MSTDDLRETEARAILARWADHAPVTDDLLDRVRRELDAGRRRARVWWMGGVAAAGACAAAAALVMSLGAGGPTRADPPISSTSLSTPPTSTPTITPTTRPTPRSTYDPLADPTLDDSSKIALRIERYGARQGRDHYSGLSSMHVDGVQGFRIYRSTGTGTDRFESQVLSIAGDTPIEFVDRDYSRATLVEVIRTIKTDRAEIEAAPGVEELGGLSPGLGGGVLMYVVGEPRAGLGRELTDRYGVPVWVKKTSRETTSW